MDEAEIERRRKLSFLQAEGMAELPRQYRKDEISRALRTKLWKLIRDDINNRMELKKLRYNNPTPWTFVFEDYYVEVLERFDKPGSDLDSAINPLFHVISEAPFGIFYNSVQWLIRNESFPSV